MHFSVFAESSRLSHKEQGIGEWLLGRQPRILSSAWNTVREEGASFVSSVFMAAISGDQGSLLLDTGVMTLAYLSYMQGQGKTTHGGHQPAFVLVPLLPSSHSLRGYFFLKGFCETVDFTLVS